MLNLVLCNARLWASIMFVLPCPIVPMLIWLGGRRTTFGLGVAALIAVILTAVVMSIVSSFFLPAWRAARTLLAKGAEVEGVVVAGGSGYKGMSTIAFEYEFDGETYTSEGTHSARAAGEPIALLVDPDDPQTHLAID